MAPGAWSGLVWSGLVLARNGLDYRSLFLRVNRQASDWQPWLNRINKAGRAGSENLRGRPDCLAYDISNHVSSDGGIVQLRWPWPML